MEFPGRKLTFPIVLDDKWNTEALERYMRSIRNEAVYLPSNIEYLARNNGIEGGKQEALKLLVSSPWVSTIYALVRIYELIYYVAGVWCWFLPCLPIPCTGLSNQFSSQERSLIVNS